MARIKVKLSEDTDELVKALSDKQIFNILVESTPPLEKAMKKNAEKLVRSDRFGKKRTTGALAKSIKPTKPRRGGRGANSAYVVVRPTGKDSKGVRNMEKMVYNEYGTHSHKHIQVPHPILPKTVAESEDAVADLMQSGLERELGV